MGSKLLCRIVPLLAPALAPSLASWLAPLLATLLVVGCAISPLKTSWRSPEYAGPTFKKVLVVGISEDQANRRVFEDVFVSRLGARGIEAIPGYRYLSEASRPDMDVLKKAVREAGADAVVTTRLIRLEEETRVYSTPGYMRVTPGGPYVYGPYHWAYHWPYRWPYTFYNYYGSVFTYYQPTVVQYQVATIETSLFEAGNGSLVWAGTTQFFDPDDVKELSEQLADAVIANLGEAGLLLLPKP